uniref:SMP-30/Gluconolactonase/LRE-like region domain-containing protein n=1 Tax=Branchiostoma floridae TaxID=7739 RepID=C3ZL16_BRAFL|eukprot:XP_002590687.1 hypothetical protein BRAFLDRAFT_89488 [Branchiostoma floridae]
MAQANPSNLVILEDIVESASNVGNSCIQPYAVKYQENDESAVGPADCEVIQPYAVKYQKHGVSGNDRPVRRTDVADATGQTANVASDDVDIEPYAVAYMDQDDIASGDIHTQTRSPMQKPMAASNITNDVLSTPSSNGAKSSDNVSEERQHVQNALHPNPMYVPNIQHPAAWECARRRTCLINVAVAVVLGGCIVGGISLWVFASTNPPETTTTVATTFTSVPTDCCSSVPTPPAVSNSSQSTESYVRKLDNITFGGIGKEKEPGKFTKIYGVAVSADSEIFVTDLFNNRVQVFSINGTYLRLFPTAVPGENWRMYPFSVAIDVKPGCLWVVGGRVAYHPDAQVVQYRRDGHPINTFGIRFMSWSPHPSIAIDVRNNKVIVGEGHMIMVFQPNGSLVWGFEVFNKELTHKVVGGVVSDRERNILLTDSHRSIMKYNQFGEKILEFEIREDKLLAPKGICVDSLGRIIVANKAKYRVDMFTSRGEFVRTVANMKNPWGVAMGTDGQLVVTDPFGATVTIFPRHLVFL